MSLQSPPVILKNVFAGYYLTLWNYLVKLFQAVQTMSTSSFQSQSFSSGGVLSGGGSPVEVFAFRARTAINMGAVFLTMTGGAWAASDVAFWRISMIKNGAGTGSKDLSTVGAGGTGSIAAQGTVQLFASAFLQCAAGDVYVIKFTPIGGPLDLALAEISFDLNPVTP